MLLTASQESKVQSTCAGCASGAMGTADVEMLHEVKQQLMQLQDLVSMLRYRDLPFTCYQTCILNTLVFKKKKNSVMQVPIH